MNTPTPRDYHIRLLLAALVPLAFAAVAISPPAAKGMYDPKHGRWLQRDPAGYTDGMSLYVSVRNSPTGGVDPHGKWDHRVHKDMTIDWAVDSGMKRGAARLVGDFNEATDTEPFSFGIFKYHVQSWAPFTGQGYHFNLNKSGPDSRHEHRDQDYDKAIKACVDNDDPGTASRWLGHSLHALQDWYAHGEYNSGGSGDFLTSDTFLTHGPYYDDPNYDAIGPVYTVHYMSDAASLIDAKLGYPEPPAYPLYTYYASKAVNRPGPGGTTPVNGRSDGRPPKVYGKRTVATMGVGSMVFKTHYFHARWPFWTTGNRRVTGTEKESRAHIDKFLRRVCSECNEGRCPKCQCHFLQFWDPYLGRGSRDGFCWR